MTREQAVQIIENMPISHECREFFGLTLETLKQPEVIRCKHCKFRHDSLQCQMYSEGMDTPDDWFCADGKRAEVNWK